MPIDQSLIGRSYPPTEAFAVTEQHVRAFVEATGGEYDAARATAPATYPIVLAFDAMNAFLAAEQVDLYRIVHGSQKFSYERPVKVGDTLSATLTVTSLRQIGGNDIISTTSEIRDSGGALVCTTASTLLHKGDA